MKYISKDPPCPPYEANPVGVSAKPLTTALSESVICALDR
jgi:hypothetical protein